MTLIAFTAPVAGVALGAFLWHRLLRACEAANVADWGSRWLNRLDGLNRIFCRRFHRLRHEPLELPARGGVLVASNHVSGLDPLLLIAASPRPLRFMIAREQYDRWWLRWLFRAIGCIPVERTRNPRAALYAAIEVLQRGEVVALFPQGRIHLDHQPPTRLKRGIVLMAQMTGAPIYPVRVEGVRAQGLTVTAVFIPSHARVQVFAPMQCGGREVDGCLAKLWDILAPPAMIDDHENPHRPRHSHRPQAPE
jgi:1-acyl-sn-glycerol-3-phosphate acyltransferase